MPWQRPLDSCNQKCLLWVGRPRKPPVISNHILAISHRNAFICIYSNFSPKIGCHGNAPLSLVYGSVTDELPDITNPISKPRSVWICRLQLRLWPFFDFLAYFGQNLVALATSLRPLQSEIFSLDWSPRKPPVISNHILAISHRNAFTAILLPKSVGMVTPLCPLCTGVS